MIILLALFTIPFRIVAQPNRYGISILTHYSHTVTGSDGRFSSITRDGRGVLYVAVEDSGILEYDGVRWQSLPLRGEPDIRAMATGEDGVVYTGGVDNFGCLLPDPDGNVQYVSLADSAGREYLPVSGTVYPCILGEKVFYCSPTAIFEYDPAERNMSYHEPPDRITGAFGMDSMIVLTGEETGPIKFNGQEFETLPGGQAFKGFDVSGLAGMNRNRFLVASRSDGLLLYDPESGSVDESFVDRRIQQYLREGIPTQLRPLGAGFAVATRNSGIVLLDQDGNAVQLINVEEGLPDPYVAWLYIGKAEGGPGPLWIAHGKGISKLEIDNPLTVISGKAGFDGLITDIASFNGKLFLATTTGLYYLYSTPLSTGFRPITGLEGEEIQKLQVFSPSRWGNMLIASSGEHTWLIDPYLRLRKLEERIVDPAQDPAWPEEPVGKFLVRDPHRPNTIYTGGYQLLGLEYSRRGWSEVMRTDIPETASGRMEVDRYGFLWASTPQQLIRMDITRLSHVEQRTYSTTDGLPAGDNMLVFMDPDYNTLLVGTEDGFYRFDYFGSTFYRDTLLNTLLPPGKNLIHLLYRDPEGTMWLSYRNDFNGWSVLVTGQQKGPRKTILEHPFMRLSEGPIERFISEDGKSIWFGKAGTLYHLDKSIPGREPAHFSALIRSVTLDRDSVLFRGYFYRKIPGAGYRISADQEKEKAPKLGHRENSLSFEWAAPCLEAEERMVYSIRMEGRDLQWSDWNGTSKKSYSDLPSGTYSFKVRAKNIYGEISKPATFAFRIRKPWYGSLPALLIYIMLAAGGITLLFRNRQP
ncbi:MAG: triple tyrosine motif-containing protein [Bacteroidales bacterium]